MEKNDLLDIYQREAGELVTLYLSSISRISGALSSNKISGRFWEFNLLMQELEQVLDEKANDLIRLYAVSDEEKISMRGPMQQIAREACRNFNNKGRPGSGNNSVTQLP